MTVVYGIYALQWDCSIPITPIANPKADRNHNIDYKPDIPNPNPN